MGYFETYKAAIVGPDNKSLILTGENTMLRHKDNYFYNQEIWTLKRRAILYYNYNLHPSRNSLNKEYNIRPYTVSILSKSSRLNLHKSDPVIDRKFSARNFPQSKSHFSAV